MQTCSSVPGVPHRDHHKFQLNFRRPCDDNGVPSSAIVQSTIIGTGLDITLSSARSGVSAGLVKGAWRWVMRSRLGWLRFVIWLWPL